ncbi:MAG: metalloregulator ArsR/SmtB family transcription factor [Chloroflexales bacterium]
MQNRQGCAPGQPAAIFKTLAHPVRIAILDLLRHGEECVCHMEAILDKRQAYISQQLAILRAAQIIADRRDGMNIFYRVVRPEIYVLLDAACAMSTLPTTTPSAVIRRESCPCPKCTPVVAIAD